MEIVAGGNKWGWNERNGCLTIHWRHKQKKEKEKKIGTKNGFGSQVSHVKNENLILHAECTGFPKLLQANSYTNISKED
jgi:hypothetical protein